MNKYMDKIQVTLIGKCDEENYIIAKVRKALRDWGRQGEAQSYELEVKGANSWAEVMRITAKYVDII